MTSAADAAGRASAPTPVWTVVIPVKAPAGAKTRLAAAVAPAEREALARAFALDTIAAALAARTVARVIVVGDDPSLAGAAEFLPEPADALRGLTRAIASGIDHARAGDDGPGLRPVAVLLGDLPALAPEELDAALAAASRHPLAFVRDADGTGTTLATASAGVGLAPRFGADSAARHAAAGFVELAASAGLRRDVDTIDALADALALGVGPLTRRATAGIPLRGGSVAP
ncbi:2-phospho-L-lactate guanylyltransferase [Agromyces cerinus]|uniref:Phosphoenolpyruvate guanylyltransferase n=1 Tax=Agromyces cerinus subsp. cerinus TaxID=232089 RepID=A0A1N6EP04_9MICO|nr:2-phospho-L-lactate guanylyltransferase [Agromyces cerinus]SIN84710.1 2-phospho-L-lactate guanylyltransferase [Agromyces cerinus subsp. cerinus]